MTSLDDSRNLERIAKALERSAAADERRNKLLIDEMTERKAAWERSEGVLAERLERILRAPPGDWHVGPVDDPLETDYAHVEPTT